MASSTATSPRRALITGITGQDGSYLAELLLSKGQKGTRSTASFAASPSKIPKTAFPASPGSGRGSNCRPPPSKATPAFTRLWRRCARKSATTWQPKALSAIRSTMSSPRSRPTFWGPTTCCRPCGRSFRSAGSISPVPAKCSARRRTVPQDELTRFHPRSTYGISKVAGYELTRIIVRPTACMPRAESSSITNRRGADSSSSPARLQRGWHASLPGGRTSCAWGTSTRNATGGTPAITSTPCGSCSSRPEPDDYVVATGETHSVREFVELAFDRAGLDWQAYVKPDPDLYRPAEVNLLQGNAGKARRVLGWSHRVTFPELVREMLEHDCRALGIADRLPRSCAPMQSAPHQGS